MLQRIEWAQVLQSLRALSAHAEMHASIRHSLSPYLCTQVLLHRNFYSRHGAFRIKTLDVVCTVARQAFFFCADGTVPSESKLSTWCARSPVRLFAYASSSASLDEDEEDASSLAGPSTSCVSAPSTSLPVSAGKAASVAAVTA